MERLMFIVLRELELPSRYGFLMGSNFFDVPLGGLKNPFGEVARIWLYVCSSGAFGKTSISSSK
ncbi:hypothetical protein bsdtb5_36120 [Anaeromicropila herbilytica]|uniref:Uncharacterized protein n=1 Tax=Anaeromicropila herbilytica TaxID=2785025 RepID=A0A7R7IE69_9FIRM|nr:hypothetical protein bsdtb5_36120 [Anaeromicropila herbilytica]